MSAAHANRRNGEGLEPVTFDEGDNLEDLLL